MRRSLVLVALLAGLAATAGAQEFIPLPREADWEAAVLPLPDTLRCALADPSLAPLLDVLDYEVHMRTGVRVVQGLDDALCRLEIDPSLDEEAYRLAVGDRIELAGGSYRAVAMGSVTLVQAIRPHGAGHAVPRGAVEDAPAKPYRGVLVDVARQWHDVHTLEQVILLCRWYKVNHLHLHLTDDESFTFPTAAFPVLPTPGRHYTREDLVELDRFARERGVTLVPELEVPGHARQLVERVPEVFAIGQGQGNVVHMGREAVYEALDRIVGEVAEVFATSPYLHVGGDEVNLERLEGDPEAERYLAAHGLPDLQALYRHFIVRADESVRRHGKQAIVWEGFGRGAAVEIPRDVVVMAWDTRYRLPQDLLADGHPIINVSWKPLYVAWQRKWDPATIHAWNVYRWENWWPEAPSHHPIQLDPTPQVLGASMASWAQPPHLTLSGLRERLAAMSERAWHATREPVRPAPAFLRALAETDAALRDVLSPVRIAAEGLRHPGVRDGHWNEQGWFADTLTLTLTADSNQVIHFTLDGRLPTPEDPHYDGPITLTADASLRARAFTPSGEPVGYARWEAYRLHPIEAHVEGALQAPLGTRWEEPGSLEAAFDGPLTITLTSGRAGTLRYTTDGTDLSPEAPVYTEPIRLEASAHVKAQLFDAAGAPLGHPWVQRFRQGRPAPKRSPCPPPLSDPAAR